MAISSPRLGAVLQAMKTEFESLKAADGSTSLLSKVFLAIDEVTPAAFDSFPSLVLGTEGSTWDDENPDLGTETITVDVWTKYLATPGAGQELSGEFGNRYIVDKIRSEKSHFSGGDFGSGVSMTDVTKPEEIPFKGRVNLTHSRITFEMLRG